MRNPYSELVRQARASNDLEALQWATMAYDTFMIGAARAAAGNAALARSRLSELKTLGRAAVRMPFEGVRT